MVDSACDDRVHDYEVTFITESGEPNKHFKLMIDVFSAMRHRLPHV